MSQDPNKEDQQTAMTKGARGACTICRAVKMKCVGADIKSGKPCDRCLKQGTGCVFEQHRRGRKPGSVLSESSKMLRRLEKRLGTAKVKSGALQNRNTPWPADSAALVSSTYLSSNKIAGLRFDDQSEDEDENTSLMAPAKLISKEYKRQTSLELELHPPSWVTPVSATDPVSAGIIDDATADVLIDYFFLRINQFICLFDPALHTVDYIRGRSPFLFTVLIMASCKFFKPEVFHQCQGLAQKLATHALAEDWKSVEVVQAFACLCYWEDPGHTRTWSYIGHACRMAIEIGLNLSKSRSSLVNETDTQRRERRNRERTYLVLFVHDRSLAMHTGRPWMLPEDELVRNAHHWYENGGEASMRPCDIVVSAMVELRCGLGKTTQNLRSPSRSSHECREPTSGDADRLQSSNEELIGWINLWEDEMGRAGGERVHVALLRYMWVYVRVLNNSFFLKGASSRGTLHTVVSTCYESALEGLRIASCEYSPMNVLRYAQDSLTLMNAYFAVFLVRLLRRSDTRTLLHESATSEIYQAISLTADAYESAAASSPACGSLTHHAQFLRSLTAQDVFQAPAYTYAESSSPYAPMQPLHEEQTNTWAAPPSSTSTYNPMMYAPSWDMAALTQTYSQPAVVPQSSTVMYETQPQYHAASVPAASADYQVSWKQAHYGVEGAGQVNFAAHTYGNQGTW